MSAGQRIDPRRLKQVMDEDYGLGQNRAWQIPNDTRDGRLGSMGLYDTLDDMIESGDTVIEVGCSIGRTTQELDTRYDAEVIGIDLYDGFLEEGQYVQAGASQLPVKDDAVDHIIAPNSLGRVVRKGLADHLGENITTGQYVDTVLSEIERVTPEGGTFLLADGEDGAAYLRMEHTDDGLDLQEQCSYDGRWRSRHAEYMYREWLQSDLLNTDEYEQTVMTPDDIS